MSPASASRAYIPRAGRSDWRTPPEVVERVREALGGHISLDPCSASHDGFADINLPGPTGSAHDGLAQGWHGGVYVNPPFDALATWAAKCASERRDRGSEVILLLPARTDTAYWHDHVSTADLICFWRGRMKFVGAPASCPFPVALAYWGDRPALFPAVFSPKGMVVAP
jgi:hypothetical protein